VFERDVLFRSPEMQYGEICFFYFLRICIEWGKMKKCQEFPFLWVCDK
jgi:hypothetical protein